MTLSIERIELAAEGRVLFEQAGEVAVQGVGHRGDREDHQRPEIKLVGDQGEDEDGQHEPADGQRVRNVPEPAGRRLRPLRRRFCGPLMRTS